MKFRPSEIRMMQETREIIKIRGLSGLNIASFPSFFWLMMS